VSSGLANVVELAVRPSRQVFEPEVFTPVAFRTVSEKPLFRNHLSVEIYRGANANSAICSWMLALATGLIDGARQNLVGELLLGLSVRSGLVNGLALHAVCGALGILRAWPAHTVSTTNSVLTSWGAEGPVDGVARGNIRNPDAQCGRPASAATI